MVDTSGTVNIWSDGSVYYFPMGQIMTGCGVDLTMFPFDMQECHVIAESWNYDSTQQEMEMMGFHQIDNFFIENEMWDILDNRSVVLSTTYSTPNNTAAGYHRVIYRTFVANNHSKFLIL